MQLQRGEKPNAEAVRQAILNSAIPCDPEEVEEPERCLMGKLNIPGAYELLTGEQLTTHPEIYFQQHTVIPSSDNRPEINDTVGELTGVSDPSPTPPLRGESKKAPSAELIVVVGM
jgi:hypothetical protein